MVEMDFEELGTQVREKREKKTKEKSKKETKRTKKRKVEDGSGTEESNGHIGEVGKSECGKGSESESANCVTEKGSGKEKKKKKGEQQSPDELQNGTGDSAVGQGSGGNFCFGAENMDVTQLTEHAMPSESVEKEKKRKKLKRKKDKSKEQEICEKSNEPGESVEAFGESHALEGVEKKEKRKKKRQKDVSRVSEGDVNDVSKDEKKRKKKSKKVKGESGSGADTTMYLEFDGHLNDGTKNKKGKAESDDVGSKDPKPKKIKKKVSFSGKDEVFQLPEDNLVRGKRFSKEEDEMVKEAVLNYIETNCLGEEGLHKVLNCSSYPKIRNCWKEIGTALPHRPQSAVYYRAHTLFRRDEKRKWTKEEIEILRTSQKKFGNQWSAVADELGKHRVHVKDTWRRIRHENLKKGRWSQDEYQTLFDLVNLDLRMKYAEEKKSKHGMLRDNVPWTAISDRLTTRAEPTCCVKWYSQLTSPMVTNGDWADSDDYRMIDALYELDASCYEDVDWDNLLEHRYGTICQKRWSEMVLHIGENMNKSFANQVEVLAKRYCPELLEAKENWESKPVVP